MERVLEPEVMDGEAQCEAYARADFADVNAAFVERLEDAHGALRGRLVDLGCGPADIALRLARRHPSLNISAVDASEAMLRFAREAIDAAGLGQRVSLVHGRLPEVLAELGGGFDVVISNSLLHHLPHPAVLWDATRALGRSGAKVLVVDLRRPASAARAHALVETYSGEEPEILQHDFYHSLLAAFTPDEVRGQLSEVGLELTVTEISDRHLAVTGTLA